MSSIPNRNTAQQCQRINWEGSLPITLSLAPTSLSSPTMPPSLHRMVPRQSYLHIGLEQDVRLLSKFAPSANFRPSQSSMSSNHWKDDEASSPSRRSGDGDTDEATIDSNNAKNDSNEEDGDKIGAGSKKNRHDRSTKNDTTAGPYPICWFEDEETGTPIRWHLFVGVIYDLFRLRRFWCNNENDSSRRPYPTDRLLPWKIQVHFTSYPTSLLPLQRDDSDNCVDPHSTTPSLPPLSVQKFNDDLLKTLSKHYINSLKTALYVQHNSNRVSRRCMTKNSDLDLWDSIVRNNWGLYRNVCQGFDGDSASVAEQKKCDCEGDENNDARDLHNVPIRILVDANPAMTRACCPYHEEVVAKGSEEVVNNNDKYGNAQPKKKKMMTVGEVLMEWLPHLFMSVKDNSRENEPQFVNDCQWCIQGLQVPWDSPIANLWRGLSHPDRFLYIIVITKNSSV